MEQSINDIIPGLGLQNIIEILLAFFLTSIRLSAFIIASPLFSARFIMLRVRIIIAFVISIIVFSVHPLELDIKILTSAYGIAIIFKVDKKFPLHYPLEFKIQADTLLIYYLIKYQKHFILEHKCCVYQMDNGILKKF